MPRPRKPTPRASAGPSLPPRLAPRRRPRQARSEALVEAILTAAGALLGAHGWDGLSLTEVAKQAGVSPGSLYQYFPDKASLVAELIERLSAREVAFHLETLAGLEDGLAFDAWMEVLVRGAIAFQRREGPFMREALRALVHIGRHDLLSLRVRGVADAMEARLAGRHGVSDEAERRLAVHVLVNAVHSVSHDGVLPRPAWLDDEQLVSAAMRLVRGYLLAAGPGSRGEGG